MADPVEPPPGELARQVLTVFYQNLDGPSWANNGNWLTDAPLDTWYGVETDSEGNVTGLSLRNNYLTGSIYSATSRTWRNSFSLNRH